MRYSLTRRIATRLVRRVRPNSTVGLSWKHQNGFITFEWDGFASAPTIPLMFARQHYEVALIRRMLSEREIGRCLEVGCGFGRLSPTLADLARSHVGLDINEEALVQARTAYPELTFTAGSVTDIPFPDGSVDLLVSWTVIQHVPPVLIEQAMAEIKRVLAPGGRVLLCEETRTPGHKTKHSWHRERQFYVERLAPLHLRLHTIVEEIERLPGMLTPGEVMLFETPAGPA